MRLKTTDQAAGFDELGVRMCCRVQVWDQDKATVILFLWLCSAQFKNRGNTCIHLCRVPTVLLCLTQYVINTNCQCVFAVSIQDIITTDILTETFPNLEGNAQA